MKIRLLLAVLLGAALMSVSAAAETVRYPEGAAPAFNVSFPDEWTHRISQNGTSMLVFTADHTASMALTVRAFTGTPNDYANAELNASCVTPLQNMGTAKISGHDGTIFECKMTNPTGAHINLHMVAMKLDATHVASATLLSVDNINAEQYAAVRNVFDAVTLTGQAP